MAIRQIRTVGDDSLTKKCRVVEDFDNRLHTLIDDMWDTLHDAKGLGLAAPQVGVIRRVVVIEYEDRRFELINPVITTSEGKLVDVEACLSVPEKMGEVERPERLTVKAQDRFGKEQSFDVEGYLARCFCHELDHLDGVLYTSRVIRFIEPEELEEETEAKSK